jgi:hypothetical protein
LLIPRPIPRTTPVVAIRPTPVVVVPIPGCVVRRAVALVAVIPPGAVGAPVAPPTRVPIPRAVASLFVGHLFVRRRRGLVHRLVALDRLLWAQLDRRADVLKVQVELVDKIDNIFDIKLLDVLPGGELDYYVHVGDGVSGVGDRLHRDALVGVVARV